MVALPATKINETAGNGLVGTPAAGVGAHAFVPPKHAKVATNADPAHRPPRIPENCGFAPGLIALLVAAGEQEDLRYVFAVRMRSVYPPTALRKNWLTSCCESP
jgi:hypothetical protein